MNKQMWWRLTKVITFPIWFPIFIIGACIVAVVIGIPALILDAVVYMPYTYVKYGKSKSFTGAFE